MKKVGRVRRFEKGGEVDDNENISPAKSAALARLHVMMGKEAHSAQRRKKAGLPSYSKLAGVRPTGFEETQATPMGYTGLLRPPKEAVQEYEDAKKRKLEETAPTTRTTMGDKPFKKGGSIRGGGVESRGKTKGRMV